MPVNVTALIFVLAMAVPVFWLAKPVALIFSSERDFTRRRNVWLVLTVVGFLSPSFWLFVLVAVPVLISAARKDTNPVGLYLFLLSVVPATPVDIPVSGIEHLFPLNIYRLLSLCVLLPLAVRQWRSKQAAAAPFAFGAVDVFLIAYGVLFTLLYVPGDWAPGHIILPDSFTNLVRRAFLFFIDVYVLYFVVSRTCSSRGAIIDALAAFCLSCALLAPMAVYEAVKGWWLYAALVEQWTGNPQVWWSVLRGGVLRAQVTAEGALILGYVLAIGFGFWLYLKSHVPSRLARVAGVVLYWAGMLAAYSRGPWIGALSILIAFAALGQRALPRLLKTSALLAICLGAVLASPLGEKITSVLPWTGGSVDQEDITYRQLIADRSWQLIAEHPLFGDQLAFTEMEDLRQGQGIVDLVNTYAQVALDYGFVGLSLFLAFILVALSRAYRFAKRATQSDPDLALLGMNLIACIVGTLVMIWGCSFIDAYEKMYYVLGALSVAYARLAPASQLQPAATSEHCPQQDKSMRNNLALETVKRLNAP
jgi:hypothetical protein